MLKKEIKYIIYTSSECPKCTEQKKKWDAEDILYEERDASRLKNPTDNIDTEALIEAAMNNEVLPVIIRREDVK